MTQRTYSEISEEVNRQRDARDADTLLLCAEELDQLGTTQGQALAARSRGTVFLLRNHDTTRALDCFQQALDLFESINDHAGVAISLRYIGITYAKLGRTNDALEYYYRALDLSTEIDDRRGVAIVRRRIGIVLQETGNNAEAFSLYHQALNTFRELELPRDIAIVLSCIGTVHRNNGRYPDALELFNESLSLFERLNDEDGVARSTSDIGDVYYAIRDFTSALDYKKRALAMFESLGNDLEIASTLSTIGNIHIVEENIELGLDYYRRALALCEKLGLQPRIAHTTGLVLGALVRTGLSDEADQLLAKMDTMTNLNLHDRLYREACRSVIQEHRGSLDDARSTLLAALSVAQKHHIPPQEAELHGQLRDLALKQNDLASYVEHSNAYQRICEEINGKETTSRLAIQEAERRMEFERQEHQKQLAVLHSTLPKHIADRVARGEQVNDHYDNAAVIFLDIVGFTTLSDKLSSAEVIQLLDTVFTSLDAVCKKHDVVKIKTIGDSYMAVAFPSESSSSEQQIASVAKRAAHTALEMLNAVSMIMIPNGSPEGSPERSHVSVRIGVHCGAVTAGVLGKERLQYDVWGDTVNVASRMESTGEPGRIHVSDAFVAMLTSPPSHLDHSNTSPPNPLSSLRGGTSLTPLELERGGAEGAGVRYQANGGAEVRFQITLRGETELKGKGVMTTYWLEPVSPPNF